MQAAIKSVQALSVIIGTASLLAACGGGGSSTTSTSVPPPVTPPAQVVIDNSGTPGSLVQNPPPRLNSLRSADVTSQLQGYGFFGTQLLANAGAPKCGIDFYHFEYGTVGAAGEQATASGGILVPTGSDPACTGPRPVLLYGHGSSLYQYVNMADISSANPYLVTTAEIEALFVAQGYIVVAPNYAGYDTSTLPYHPEHIAAQNGQDMINALIAARKSFPNLGTPVVDNGKLFLSGYSEGGYVTMATHRAMQAAGMTVTASVPQSGEYAVSIDWESLGQPGALDDLSGVTGSEGGLGILFQFTAYQKAYGNLYGSPSDFYSTTLAGSLETLLPTKLDPDNLVALGLFPKYLLGNDMPNYPSLTPFEQSFYGPPTQSLLKSSAVLSLVADVAANPCPVTSATAPLNCSPTNPVRIDGMKNDLRTWTPTQPMLMCGGNGDPNVGFINAQLAQAYFQAHGTTVAVLDVDSPITANDPYADAKSAFLAAKNNIVAAGGDPTTSDSYHGTMAFAGCNVAARDFFSKF